MAIDLIPRNPDFAAELRARMAASPVFAFYGFELDSIDPGEVALSLAGRPELGHRPGFFQGTIVGAIADYAGSFATYTLIPADWSRLTLDYTVKFLAPAEGERLIGRGRVLSAGRSLSVAAADVLVVREGTPHLCATALMTTRHIPPTS